MKCECGFASEKIKRWPFKCRCGRRYEQNGAMPPILDQAKNVIREVATWASAGGPRRTEAEQVECLATCQACEQFNAEKGRCSKCGCNVRVAVLLRTKRCPLGRWPAD